MIYLYSGTPGSGKSLHATQEIIHYLGTGKPVISNYSVDLQRFPKINQKRLIVLDNSEITPDYLMMFARCVAKACRENQILLVLDECGSMLNCRDYGDKSRQAWNTFFQQHRKYGYNIILIAQFDKMIDKQIRMNIEYEVVHRNIANAGSFGWILKILGIPCFLAIEKWYSQKMIVDRNVIPISKKLTQSYNTFQTFGNDRPAPDMGNSRGPRSAAADKNK